MKQLTWTTTMVQQLRALYSTHSRQQVAAIMNIPVGKITGATKRYKISAGRKTTFTKGQTAWNKGKTMRLSPATEFRKGNLPHNTKADGVITVRKDNGTGRLYKYVRISLGNWQLLHRVIWQQHNGPIPAGHLVTFIDGNSLNCEIDNLQLLSKASNALKNHNPAKAAVSLARLWKQERIRRDYGMSPKSGFGKILQKAA